MKFIAFLACLLLSSMLFAQALTPIGNWVQISDKTQKPRSIIQIYNDHGTLAGKVIKAFPENGIPPRKICDTCPGKLKNAPIIGLPIMNNFVQTDQNVWGNGTILDPESGKIYSCRLTLEDNGKELNVRGYIGFSLLGRTQTWIRQG